jgi:hypothetical protein
MYKTGFKKFIFYRFIEFASGDILGNLRNNDAGNWHRGSLRQLLEWGQRGENLEEPSSKFLLSNRTQKCLNLVYSSNEFKKIKSFCSKNVVKVGTDRTRKLVGGRGGSCGL